MHDLIKLIRTLEWLNDLQLEPHPTWKTTLSPGERNLALENLRKSLPLSLLGHHDRMVAKNRRSITAVKRGTCGACHLKLPRGHNKPSQGRYELDVCDHCGVFLHWLLADNEAVEISPRNKVKTEKLVDLLRR